MALLYQRKKEILPTLVKKYRIIHFSKIFANFHGHSHDNVHNHRRAQSNE